jgi:CRP/FNR family transcriptional regulator, cyclic AMP receptor protein
VSGHGWQSDPVSQTPNTIALSLIERVTLLSRVAFFQRIPTHILAAVAEHCEEQLADAGTVVLTEGESGDYLLVIADGVVRVSSQTTTFDLESGEVVGELAVLDPGPRNATVTALTNVRLLKLGSAVVDELLLDHPEVSRSIITGVVRRLRGAMQTASREPAPLRVPPVGSLPTGKPDSERFELGHF